jgi:endonuclease-3
MPASVQKRKQQVAAILPVLKAEYPQANCRLDFKTPLQLLVATILSAQCTDDRVNIVTRDLFRKYPKTADYAAASVAQLQRDIQSIGFFRAKSRSLQGMARSLIEKHGGEVPRTMEELTALPGVGRKTANVVLGNAFDVSVGITVDRHVARVSQRLGLTAHEDAGKIEKDLVKVVPPADWKMWSHLLIFHGRAICVARRPRCERCLIFNHCPTGPKVIQEREKVSRRAAAR